MTSNTREIRVSYLLKKVRVLHIPIGLDINKQVNFCKEKLSEDELLCKSTVDVKPIEIYNTRTNKNFYCSDLNRLYEDSKLAEALCFENSNMKDFLIRLGYNEDEIHSNIANQCSYQSYFELHDRWSVILFNKDKSGIASIKSFHLENDAKLYALSLANKNHSKKFNSWNNCLAWQRRTENKLISIIKEEEA